MTTAIAALTLTILKAVFSPLTVGTAAFIAIALVTAIVLGGGPAPVGA